MLVETVFKNLSMCLCLFLIVIMGRNAVCFCSLEESWFLGFSNCYKIHFEISVCISTAHYLGTHFCLSNAVLHVGEPFQYQAHVTTPLSSTMTIGTNSSPLHH
jgi:hypothetical protein